MEPASGTGALETPLLSAVRSKPPTPAGITEYIKPGSSPLPNPEGMFCLYSGRKTTSPGQGRGELVQTKRRRDFVSGEVGRQRSDESGRVISYWLTVIGGRMSEVRNQPFATISHRQIRRALSGIKTRSAPLAVKVRTALAFKRIVGKL